MLILVGLTYAYFLTRINGNTNDKSISVSTANLYIEYSDNNDVITGDKIEPGTTLPSKTFTVSNKGSKTVDYSVGLVNVINTFINTKDVVYTLTCTSSVANKECNELNETEFPNENSYIVENSIDKDEVQTYVITVSYKETGTDQSDDMNKLLEAKIDIFNPKSLTIKGNITGYDNNDYVVIQSKEQTSEIKDGSYKFIGIEPDSHKIIIKNRDTTSTLQTTLEVEKGSPNISSSKIIYNEDKNIAEVDIVVKDSNISLNANNISNGNPVFKDVILDSAKQGGENRTVMGSTVTEFTESSGENERVLNNAPDDYGTSYYYRGNVLDNYVSFADKTWRIVRINGDGSIRIILEDAGILSVFGESGGSLSAPTSNSQKENKVQFLPNSSNDSDIQLMAPPIDSGTTLYNAYVGYMYGSINASTYNLTHENKNDSIAKTKLEEWYEVNIENVSNNIHYEKYLADTMFCGDKSLESGTGIGTTSTTYKGYTRNYSSSNKTLTPTYECAKGENNTYSRYTSKLDTTTQTLNGVNINNDLNYPIGLLSADEMVFAGVYDTNTNFYLYDSSHKNYSYWTMTPSEKGKVFILLGSLLKGYEVQQTDSGTDDYKYYLRPVINLRSDLLVNNGDGTKENPYVLKLNN